MLKSALLSKLRSQKTKITKNDAVKTPKSFSKALKRPTSKTPKIAPKPQIDSPNSCVEEFDEEICELGEKFRMDPLCVSKGVAGLVKFTTENPKLKNKLFDDDQFPVFLQINSVKVPNGHPRIARIPLKHSLLTPDSEVCLIVADVKGIANKKHEEHLQHYEKLLRAKGVENIKKIMTFHEFRTEYETFEMRSRLVELYDAFLVDGKISGKTVKKCGKIFYKKRKVPTAVKLQATKLKEHIDQTLRKTSLYLHSNGDSFMVQIGHSKMGVDKLVENAFYIIKGLEKEFPGGFGNVRNVNLFTFRGLTIPIYTTLKNQNEVVVKSGDRKSKTVGTATGELSTRLNSGVVVKPTGEVVVFKLHKNRIRKNQNKIIKRVTEQGKRKGSPKETGKVDARVKIPRKRKQLKEVNAKSTDNKNMQKKQKLSVKVGQSKVSKVSKLSKKIKV